MTQDSVYRCPNVRMRFFNSFNRPLREVPVAIETGARKSFVTDGFGLIEYHEDNFAAEGKVYIEYDDGGRHLSWSAGLPTEPGSYDLHLGIWNNDPDGRE